MAVTMIGFALISVYYLLNLDLTAATGTYQVNIR